GRRRRQRERPWCVTSCLAWHASSKGLVRKGRGRPRRRSATRAGSEKTLQVPWHRPCFSPGGGRAMKGIVSILAVLAFSGAALLLPPSVYALPAADSDVLTFINAEVVRVDPSAGTITLRGNGANTVLIVEGEALAGLAKLQPGDQVMLGYRLDG